MVCLAYFWLTRISLSMKVNLFFKKNLPHIFIYNKRKKETQNNTHAHENHFEIKWFSSTCQRESNITLNAEPDVILHEMLQGSILF